MTDEAQFGRYLTDYEREAWEEYERVLDTIPNARMYDRVSLLKAHPELNAAFERVRAASTFYRLKN
jgi:hypothetical protein